MVERIILHHLQKISSDTEEMKRLVDMLLGSHKTFALMFSIS